MKSNLPENFLLLCTQTHHQGAVLTNSRCISWNRLVSKQFPFIPPPEATRIQRAEPAAPGSVGSVGTAPGWTQGSPGRAVRGRGEFAPTSAWNHPTALPERLQDTRRVCVPKDGSSSMSRWETGFFLFLFLSPKSTHGLQANQTHPRILALPRRDSSLFKLGPFKHLHRSLDIAGAVELKPMNIPGR